MVFILEKFKKWWFWIFPIAAIATTLTLLGGTECTEIFNTVADKDFRFTWRESFLSQNHMNDVVRKHPKSYPHCMVLPDEIGFEGKTLILIWEDVTASTVEDAKAKIKLENLEIASLYENINNTFTKKYEASKIPK